MQEVRRQEAENTVSDMVIEENTEQIEEKFSFAGFCEESISLLLMAYLFIIFCIYPFYISNGYADIGIDKYNFYRYITTGAFCLIIPLAAVCTFFRARNKEYLKNVWKISCIDATVIIYTIGVILSYICSDFKQTALWGEKGWNMGLITQLIFILSYFLISRFWEYEEKILYAFMAAASAVFFLGVLNRFSIYPLPIAPEISFLSTLGNINWYCGYFSVLFPIGFSIYWFTDKKWLRAVSGIAVIIGTATGVSQGSSSAFIIFGGLYLFIFCLSFRGIDKMKRFFELLLFFCVTCQGLRLWRLIGPDAFNYYAGTISDRITLSRFTLYAIVPIVILYFLLILMGRKRRMDMRRYTMLRQIILLLIIIAAGVYIMLLILNSGIDGGIRFMGGKATLTFSEFWGSSRGGTWSAGVDVFRNMSGIKKLTGVGPDCFADYLYRIPGIMERVADQFGGYRLTNAHNEWLTVLVNNGIIGFVGYAGIFLTAVIRFIKKAEKSAGREKFLYVFGLCVFAYTIHNIVSFQQILSTPFIFLMLGMGERLIRENA